MSRHIPNRIVLPFGYVVRIKLLTAAEMEEEDGEGCDGLWDSEKRTLFIRQRLPIKRLRYILAHEFQHAATDFLHQMLDDGTMKP